jgi:hypothetical protein
MKYILTSISLLFLSFSAFSQETISETSEYVAYQDTLFVLKTTSIINQGIEGINDTIVTYTPPAVDTVGLINVIGINSINELNTTVARFRNAIDFRLLLSRRNTTDALINTLGSDLDEINVSRYKNQVKGMYRIITDSTNFIVNIVDHPNNRFLRATGTLGEGNFNVRVFGRWMIGILIGGQYQYVIYDGRNKEKPIFRSPTFWLPNTISESPFNTIRLIKLR